jgi:hypothetical protein
MHTDLIMQIQDPLLTLSVHEDPRHEPSLSLLMICDVVVSHLASLKQSWGEKSCRHASNAYPSTRANTYG